VFLRGMFARAEFLYSKMGEEHINSSLGSATGFTSYLLCKLIGPLKKALHISLKLINFWQGTGSFVWLWVLISGVLGHKTFQVLTIGQSYFSEAGQFVFGNQFTSESLNNPVKKDFFNQTLDAVA